MGEFLILTDDMAFTNQGAISCQRSQFTIATSDEELPAIITVPKGPWFLAVYDRDILCMLSEVQAKKTSILGRIMKMDSNKKVTGCKIFPFL